MKKGYGFQNLEQISQDFTNFIKDFTKSNDSFQHCLQFCVVRMRECWLFLDSSTTPANENRRV